MPKGKAKFKINKDVPELICSKCSAVIKEGKYFTEEEAFTLIKSGYEDVETINLIKP